MQSLDCSIIISFTRCHLIIPRQRSGEVLKLLAFLKADRQTSWEGVKIGTDVMPRVTRRHPTPPTIFSLQPALDGRSEIAGRLSHSGDYVIRRPINFSICTSKCILAIMQFVHEPAISRFLAR